MRSLLKHRVRLRTIMFCTVALILTMALFAGALLVFIEERYQRDYLEIYQGMLSDSAGYVSEELVTARALLLRVASDLTLTRMLTATGQGYGEIINKLRYDVLPVVTAQELLLSGACRFYIVHSNARIPSVMGRFLCDPDALAQYEAEDGAQSASGQQGMRMLLLPEESVLRYSYPVYSRLTLELCGVVFMDVNLHKLLGDRLTAELPAQCLSEDGALLWQNAQADALGAAIPSGAADAFSAGGTRYRMLSLDCPALKSVFRFAIPMGGGGRVNQPSRFYLIAALTAVLAVVAVEVAVYGGFLTQLKRLTEDMKRVSAGDQSARLREEGGNELTHIARACNSMLESVLESGRTEQQAVYLALSNQLRPHFLNNALDHTRMLAVQAGQNVIADNLTYVMRYLSYNLGKQDLAVTLTDELCSVSNYIEMLQLANGGEVTLEIIPRGDMYGSLDLYTLPKFTLQPIVENCVRHGFVGQDRPHRIIVSLDHEDGMVYVQVEDNGVGISPQALQALRESLECRADRTRDATMGISLNLVRRRLELFYDREISFTIDSYEGTGTMVCICVPDHRSEEAAQ